MNDPTTVSRRAFLVTSAAASAGVVTSGAIPLQAVEGELAQDREHDSRWLIATHRGLYAGQPGTAWELQGGYSMRLTSVLRWQGRTVVGGGAGLWDVPSHGGWWVQLHDETLTEVLGLGPLPGDPGLLVASAYGVATGRRDAIAAVRWSFHTDSLTPNDRFTNAVAVTDAGWVVATEQGVLTMATGSHRWQLSSLRGTPVRALSRLRGQLWAGCDRTGVWYSDDGHRWQAAGHGLADTAVFALAAAGDRILAATEAGVFAGDGIGRWQAVGPALRVAAIGVAGDCWLAGADPGGLWQTDDAGQSWRQTEGFPERVAAICVPRSTT